MYFLPYELKCCLKRVSTVLPTHLSIYSPINFYLSTDSTASIYVLRKGFSRLTQDVYYLPIEINDNGFPAMSSTNTLTIRVCSCDSKDTILSCNVEPYVLPAGLSTGALIAILACIVILLGKSWLRMPLRIYMRLPCFNMKFQLYI